jgi:LacI family transcriptional regulator
MATINDVAKLAGVSTMTVSRVLNNSKHISAETRARVEQAIATLGYVPNALARSLRFKQSNMIALILSDITNPFFTAVARGVEDVARAHDLSVIFCNTDESEVEELKYLQLLLQRQIDGCLLVPSSNAQESLMLLRSKMVPCVVLDRRVADGQVDCVRCDSEDGAFQLVQHLIALGHRRIAMLSGPPHVSTASERVLGYRRALEDAGLPIDENLIVFGQYSEESGYQMAQQVLAYDSRITGCFAANNFIAFGALQAFREAKLRIPDHISLVSFDDIAYANTLEPFFTAMTQPAYQIGLRAAEMLLERLNGEGPEQAREVLLPIELVIGQSSGPAPLSRV